MSSLIDTPATRWPNLLFILAFSLVLMQQFWVFGKMPLLFFLFYAIAAYALTKGYLVINKSALICYMIMVICAVSSTIVVWQHTGYKELTSLSYFAVIYALFCLKPNQAVPHRALLHTWQKMTLLTAMLGCIQFGLYASIGIYADLHFLLPHFLIDGPGFVHLKDIRHGPYLVRANGMVFLEPSFFSQFLAIGLIIETLFFRRWRYMLILLAGFFCALSGTGIILLTLGGIMICLYHRKDIPLKYLLSLIGGMACLAAAVLFIPRLHSYFATRFDVLFSLPTNSSPYLRFVAPWTNMVTIFKQNALNIWFGIGSGWNHIAATLLGPHTHGYHAWVIQHANYNAFTQLAIYYGLPTALLFTGFVLFIALKPAKHTWQRIVMIMALCQFFFLSGALLTPNIGYVLLWLMFLYSGVANAKNCTH